MSAGFRHLNLRWNPFGEPDQSERPALVTGDVSEWVTDLQGPGVALQFLGDHGRGKSSRLLAIHRDGGFPYFRAGRQVVPIQPGVLLVDEVEELSPWRRWRIFQTSNSLALATHVDQSPGLLRAGLKVKTVRVGGVSAHALAAMFSRRIAWARRQDGPVPFVPADTIALLIERFDDDIRGMETWLYDCVQAMDSLGPVQLQRPAAEP